jgi:hypothetical protein
MCQIMLTLRRTLLHSFFIGGCEVGGSGLCVRSCLHSGEPCCLPVLLEGVRWEVVVTPLLMLCYLCCVCLFSCYCTSPLSNSVIFSTCALHNSSLDSDYVRRVVSTLPRTKHHLSKYFYNPLLNFVLNFEFVIFNARFLSYIKELR